MGSDIGTEHDAQCCCGPCVAAALQAEEEADRARYRDDGRDDDGDAVPVTERSPS